MKLKRILMSLLGLVILATSVRAEHLVILTTNDTHSHITPGDDGLGGVLRRKVLFDSVRVAEKNVMRIDAGDAVQGTLYFSEYEGVVEYTLFDMLGYDINIAGNHEYDNGMKALAKYYKNLKSTRISTNYDLSGTVLEGMFEPYTIREFGGKKIGFIGINLNPQGMIISENRNGIVFSDVIETANSTAEMLKTEKGVDYVIMVSHIGYSSVTEGTPGDVQVVNSSKYIDLVIGGHSHTRVNPAKSTPAWLVPNKEGRMIPVTQTGNLGKNVGLIDIDLNTFKVEYKLLPIDSRYDSRINYPEIEAFLAPYRHRVDSLMNTEVAVSAKAMDKGLGALSNWVSDAARDITAMLSGKNVDCSIMNKGGIRQPMPAGSISEGLINSMFPFDNRLQLIELTGEQILKSLEIMAQRGGDATSDDLMVVYTKDKKIKSAKIRGKNISPKKRYNVATLDYLANGGDYMAPFKGSKTLFIDNVKVARRYLDYIKELTAKGEKIDAPDELRMKMEE